MNAKKQYTQEVINKVNELGFELNSVRPENTWSRQVIAYSLDRDREITVYRSVEETTTHAHLKAYQSIEEAKETIKAYERAIAAAEYIQSIDINQMLEVDCNRIIER
jgi:hypothetical protein